MDKNIGILTAGGDSPGLNAAIRAIGKTAQGSYNMNVVGFQDGFLGLMDDQTIPLEGNVLSNILTVGGTILGTSRARPEKMTVENQPSDMTESMVETYKRHNLDGLVILGGSDTHESAYHLMKNGLNIITVPKTIDNDLVLTDTTIGFDTALGIASEAIDRLHSTAHSHHRIMIVEIMGRDAGWLTLGAGIAGGADVILIPEIPYDTHIIAETILKRTSSGKRFSIVAVSEGAISREDVEFFEHAKDVNEKIRQGTEKNIVGNQLQNMKVQFTGKTLHLANQVAEFTGLETRVTILGYVQRGGAPSTFDRILATQLGTACVSLANQGKYGVMVAMHGTKVEPVPLEQVVNRHKTVSLDHPWIVSARDVGTCLGD